MRGPARAFSFTAALHHLGRGSAGGALFSERARDRDGRAAAATRSAGDSEESERARVVGRERAVCLHTAAALLAAARFRFLDAARHEDEAELAAVTLRCAALERRRVREAAELPSAAQEFGEPGASVALEAGGEGAAAADQGAGELVQSGARRVAGAAAEAKQALGTRLRHARHEGRVRGAFRSSILMNHPCCWFSLGSALVCASKRCPRRRKLLVLALDEVPDPAYTLEQHRRTNEQSQNAGAESDTECNHVRIHDQHRIVLARVDIWIVSIS